MSKLAKILVVDDEIEYVKNLKKSLEDNGFEVLSAYNGREALEVLRRNDVNIVISDIKMPEVDGIELLSKIKITYPQIGVIIITAFGSNSIKNTVKNLGSISYLEKPFSIDTLIKIISKYLIKPGSNKIIGTIKDLILIDLIQLNCLNKKSCSLRIFTKDSRGIIFIKDGEIVHAYFSDGTEGEVALKNIFQLNNGVFSIKYDENTDKRTIYKNWQNLILELFALIDKSNNIKKQNKNSNYDEITNIINSYNNIIGFIVFNKNGTKIFHRGRIIKGLNNLVAYLSLVNTQIKNKFNVDELNFIKLNLKNDIIIIIYLKILQNHIYTLILNEEIEDLKKIFNKIIEIYQNLPQNNP